MRMSKKRRAKLYAAIHDAILDVRMKLKLPAKDDHLVAQVIHEIWRGQKDALNLQ